MGLDFQAIAPKWDEKSHSRFKEAGASPSRVAQWLAKKKAKSLVDDFPDHVLLGGDQIATVNSQILNKPGTPERAFEQLKTLSGQTHQLFTALALIYRGKIWEHVDITHLSMRRLPEETLMSYIKFDNPVDCVGAYKLEAGGAALFSSIQTEDPSAIMGIPLIKLIDILVDLGYPLNFRRYV